MTQQETIQDRTQEETTGATRRSPAGRRTILAALGAAMLGGLAFGVAPARAVAPDAAATAAGEGGEEGDGQAFAQRRLEFVLDRVGATDAQKQQIRAVFQRVAPDLKAVHAQRRQIHEGMMRAFTADPIDRASVEKLRQDGIKLADRASAIWAQAAVEAGQVLTPAQRQKLAEQLAKHGQGHGRHGHGPGGGGPGFGGGVMGGGMF